MGTSWLGEVPEVFQNMSFCRATIRVTTKFRVLGCYKGTVRDSTSINTRRVAMTVAMRAPMRTGRVELLSMRV